MPFERRNRMRSLSSDGLLKKSSIRPAAEGILPFRIFVVIAVEAVGMKTKNSSKCEKSSIIFCRLDECNAILMSSSRQNDVEVSFKGAKEPSSSFT
jgi:hypothetical protein